MSVRLAPSDCYHLSEITHMDIHKQFVKYTQDMLYYNNSAIFSVKL
jgi:hypothetical protein